MLLISTGSQGEPLSALSRMANRSHQNVVVAADDTIVLASSLIPGNENSVGEVINGLSRLGATVVHKSTALVHVSGHAPAGELRYLLNAVRPKNHMPVHGEWRHIRAHAAIARSTGIPDERIMLAPDGSVVDLVDGRASIVGEIPVGYVYVDGLAVGDIGDAVLQDRRILGEEGLPVDPGRRRRAGRQGRLRAAAVGPRVLRRRRGARSDSGRADRGGRAGRRRRGDRRAALEHTVRRLVGRWVDRTYRRRPMLIPMVVEV